MPLKPRVRIHAYIHIPKKIEQAKKTYDISSRKTGWRKCLCFFCVEFLFLKIN